MYQKLDLTPKAIHSSSGAVLLNEATVSTTASVPTVYPFHPFCTASATCRSRRVSAYSCEQGTRPAKCDSAGEQSTPRLLHTVPCSVVEEDERFSVTGKQTILFSLTRRKSFQFFGSIEEGATLFLVPFSLSCLVEAFRQAGKYSP